MWLRTTVAIAAMLGATVARADTCDTLDEISDATRDDAARLQEQGDQLFMAGQYNEALAMYRAAIATWRHPKLQAAAGLTLLKLERWVDAADMLEQALACGERGLDADLEKTRTYLATAVKQTGTIAIEVTQRGAEILLDGQQVRVERGPIEIRVMPGEHVVIAKRSDATSDPILVHVDAGQRAVAAPVLSVIDTRSRWSSWKPWAVVGLGVVIGGAGVPLLVSSQRIASDYDRAVAADCPNGCPSGMLPAATADLRDRADRRLRYAQIAFGAGVVVAATGLVLVALNGQRETRTLAPERIAVVPWTDAPGITVAGRF